MVTQARCKVLIVEDDALLRCDAVDIAEDAGLAGLPVDNADEALTVLDTENEICVMFTDIEMPGSIDGLQLAQIVYERWPSVGTIVTSGRVRVASDILPPSGRFYTKPYSSQAITADFEKAAALWRPHK